MPIAAPGCSPSARALVGRLLIAVTLLAPTVRAAHGQLLRIIEDPQGEPAGQFGRTLAAVGADIAVGAPGAGTDGASGAGLVHLFRSDGVRLRTLRALDPVAGAGFGSSVAESDGLLYVSAPADPPPGLGGLGSIQVFDASTGVLVRILRSPDPDASTTIVGGAPVRTGVPTSTAPRPTAMGFGRALLVTGDRVLVGAPESTVGDAAGAGAVYLFDIRGTLVRTLQEFPPRAGAGFGTALFVAGDVLFVGAPGVTVNGVAGAGAVHAVDLTTGTDLRELDSPLPVEGAALGTTVGRIGASLLVGAPGDTALGFAGAGRLYLFELGSVTLRQTVTPFSPASALDFGRAVVVVDGAPIVGADGANTNGETQAGRVDVLDPATFVRRLVIEPQTARAGGRFGFALSAVGSTVVVGEPALDGSAGPGRVYVFGLDGGATSGTTAGGTPAGTGGTGVRPTGAAHPPLPATCAQAATPRSVGCRINGLLATVTVSNTDRLAVPLLRALRDLGRASDARAAGRVRGWRRAARRVDEFVHRLEASRGPERAPADPQQALLAVARGVEVDLETLVAGATP